MIYTINSDYLVNDSAVLRLTAGQVVSCGHSDAVWPGWVWVVHPENDQRGYIPGDIIEVIDQGNARLLSDFDGTELSVRKGEQVEVLHQVHGWHWCRQKDGKEGWVAGYLLRPA